MTEIELKARVADPQAVRDRLNAGAVFRCAVVKNDSYWHKNGTQPDEANAPGRAVKLRLREENGNSTVTYKRKEVRGALEVNDEREFCVTDRDSFEIFLTDLDFSPYRTKRKQTEVWDWKAEDGTAVTIELSLVDRLGWFVETEILVPEADTAQVEAAAVALQSALALCGLGEDDLEPRFYTEMLAEAERTTTFLCQGPNR